MLHRDLRRLARKSILLPILVALLVLGPISVRTGSMADEPVPDPVDPPSVNDILVPGESITITKTVSVPEVPPKLDLFLMVDLSGSYYDDLPNIY